MDDKQQIYPETMFVCLATKNIKYWPNYELISNRRKNVNDGKEKNINILTQGNYYMATVNYTV